MDPKMIHKINTSEALHSNRPPAEWAHRSWIIW